MSYAATEWLPWDWLTALRQAAAGNLSMSPTWIWMQVAIVVFVLIGMIVAITKLA